MPKLTQKKIDRKISHKKDSFKLKKAERINASALTGLTSEQVQDRVDHNLVNKKALDKTKSYTKIILQNTFNFCNTLIIILCIILDILGHFDYTISSSMIAINIIIGIYQEIKAKWTVQKLSIVKQSTCTAVRDSKQVEISTEDLVLDDVFILTAGQQVPVDGLILDGAVELDESILTGESRGVKKAKDDKIMAGSIALAGEAAIRAERVGKDCYIESIANIARKVNKPESKLFTIIDRIIKAFSVILFVLGIMLVAASRVGGVDWDGTLLMAFSSMLGMIPCGMFVVTSTALAQSVLKLTKVNALPQDIYSIEMLAMVDTLLLDKTGTITDGNLEVIDNKIVDTKYDIEKIKDIILTMNEVNKDKKPTALAMNKYCEGANMLQSIEALPFSSDRKYSAITLENNVTYILGAPDFICPTAEKILKYCETKSIEGKRTLLLASFDGTIDDIDNEKTNPISVFTIEERLKDNIVSILDWFNQNDVDIKIISGDNPATVSAIATKAGVKDAWKTINCAEVTDDELRELCKDAVVFGRVSPEQKVLIVEELKKNKHTVGMVGDGVNDVRALKASDCSISFANANEAARNTSRIVLLDNDFKSMPKIVEEGRRVIGNIEKVSSMYIMKNIFIMVMTFIFAIAMLVMQDPKFGYPFSTKNMLLVEFFVIAIPSFTFALLPNQERSKGKFIRRVMIVSFPAALSMIGAAGFIFILNICGVIPGQIVMGDYVVSLASLSMTMAAFICVVFISLPWDKIRLLTIFIAAVLAIISAAVDYTYLNGYLLDVEMPETIIDGVYVLVAVAIAWFINLFARYVARNMDRKFGDNLETKFIDVTSKIKDAIMYIPRKIKANISKK